MTPDEYEAVTKADLSFGRWMWAALIVLFLCCTGLCGWFGYLLLR